MSFLDLYTSGDPLLTSSETGNPTATVLGIPFDSTHSYLPGTRFGPNAIRESFNNIEIFHPKFGVDLEKVQIDDLGNLNHTVVATEMLEMTSKTVSSILDTKKSKNLFILGGEHLLTLGVYNSMPPNTGFIVFDAHYDLRDEYAGTPLNHASYLRRLVEKHGSENIIHVGARAFVHEELEFLKTNNIKTITDDDIRDNKATKLLTDMSSVFDSVYTSFDLDVIDPGFAPGVGNPEAVGVTPRELFDLIYSLQERNIIGTDIVELNPLRDNGSTSSIAVKILSTILAMNI
ncbi:MAG: agmatinase [Candidatus Nitrosoabyssus spongiisocia]|nr:MAG: agmatinase [Nitrosopumilaceae archaeon AB1(1)]